MGRGHGRAGVTIAQAQAQAQAQKRQALSDGVCRGHRVQRWSVRLVKSVEDMDTARAMLLRLGRMLLRTN
jgi:hypothetical protein